MVIGFRYLEDDAVGSHESKQSTDARRGLSSSGRIEVGVGIKLQSKILISNTLNTVLTPQQHLKDTAVSRTDWMQCSVFAAVQDQPLTYWIKKTVRGSCLPHYCERLKIAPICRSAYLYTSLQIGNPFSQGVRCHFRFAIFLHWPANLETSGIINGGFDPQYASLLVVHFDGVLINPMLYSNSFDTGLKFGIDLPFEAVTYTATKKSQHIRTREALDCMSDKSWIHLSETLFVFEHHIGSVLALTNAPVITPEAQSRFGFDNRIQSSRKAVEKASPPSLAKLVHKFLSRFNVFNVGKAVISFSVLNVGSVHLPCKPFSSVNADLYAKGQPSLQSHMHQSKFTINVVEVNMQTLALFPFQSQFLSFTVLSNGKSLARFNARQNTYESLSNFISLHDFTSNSFFWDFRRLNVTVRTFVFDGVRLSVCLNTIRKLLCKPHEIFVKHPIDRQKYFQSFYVTYRPQCATEQNSVETCYSTDDAVLMPFQKTLHSSPPDDVFAKTHHAGSWLWSVNHFGCGLTAALWSFASLREPCFKIRNACFAQRRQDPQRTQRSS